MRITFIYNNGKYDSWRPFRPEDDGSENAIVEVTQHGRWQHFTIECDAFYSSGGICRLEITQHLDRALHTFGALLAADHLQEELDCQHHQELQKSLPGE